MMSDIRSKEGFAYGSDLVGMGKEGTLPEGRGLVT